MVRVLKPQMSLCKRLGAPELPEWPEVRKLVMEDVLHLLERQMGSYIYTLNSCDFSVSRCEVIGAGQMGSYANGGGRT